MVARRARRVRPLCLLSLCRCGSEFGDLGAPSCRLARTCRRGGRRPAEVEVVELQGVAGVLSDAVERRAEHGDGLGLCSGCEVALHSESTPTVLKTGKFALSGSAAGDGWVLEQLGCFGNVGGRHADVRTEAPVRVEEHVETTERRDQRSWLGSLWVEARRWCVVSAYRAPFLRPSPLDHRHSPLAQSA